MSLIVNDYMPEVRILRDEIHENRAIRYCDICTCQIQRGEKYRTLVMLIDGEFSVVKSHEHMTACEMTAGWAQLQK